MPAKVLTTPVSSPITMLGALYGSARSMDRAAQSMDFAYDTNNFTIIFPCGADNIRTDW